MHLERVTQDAHSCALIHHGGPHGVAAGLVGRNAAAQLDRLMYRVAANHLGPGRCSRFRFCDLFCGFRAGPMGRLVVKLGDGEWHCRQIVFTLARFNSRGFGPPCGVWHAVHPSVLTTACSYTNGPAVSVWHLVQTASCCVEDRNPFSPNVPCGSWQSEHFTSPSSTL